MVSDGIDSGPRLIFTAPWEPVYVRRGDALGLRALTDQFGDALAPDFSNRIRDGRWVTILSWCMVRSQEAFHASGGRCVTTRNEQRERYAWLRPLELMWVARTITLTADWDKRSLAGQRRIRPWNEGGKQPTSRFGMTEDQFRAYRQTGMYGGYRLAFRKWPGMTLRGDGWSPGSATRVLAKWLDARLGAARLQFESHENSPSTRSAKLGRGEEDRWWCRQWKTFDQGCRHVDKNTLPRSRDEYDELPESEMLRPLVFGSDPLGELRLKVTHEAAKCSATEHIDLCEHLAHVLGNNSRVALLPRFSRLADAGMAAMDLVSEVLRGNSRVSLADVAAHPASAHTCKELMTAAKAWCKSIEMPVPHIETAHRLASGIKSARPTECLRALLQHHEVHGGGLRWFVFRNGWVEPRTPPRAGSSRYRFRLWPLCRLATQCGVLRNMPCALRTEDESEDEAQASETAGGVYE